MKPILTSFFALLFMFTWANGKSQPVLMYEIISDSVDTKVPSGKCLITGIVTYEGNPVNEAVIFTASTRQINSDKLGRFKILVDTADTYLTITKKNITPAYVEHYPFKNQHHIHIKVIMPTPNMMIIVDKPVIYAYGEEGKEFQINVEPKGEFTFTYPQIDDQNNWTAILQKDGIEIGNKKYPYLFYETQMNHLEFNSEKKGFKGSVVKQNEIVTFLENSLNTINLNRQEQTDFITYWAPKMIQHEQVFVQFWINSDYDDISTLKISPQPDHVGRLFMVYAPIENGQEIRCEKQTLSSIKREGFTIIEWGGSELPKQQLYTFKTL